MISMKYKNGKRWSVAEILDYDYLHYIDKSTPANELMLRDRNIYLSSGAGNGTHWPHRKLARIWMNARHRQSPDIGLPGAVFVRINRIINWSITGIGLFIGMLYGFGVLKYTGKEAINILVSFLLLVVLPLVFTVVTAILMLMGKYIGRRNQGKDNPIWRRIYRRIVHSFISSEQKRRGAEAFLNNISIRLKKYGTAPGWLVTVRFQLFAFAIQVGSLLAVLLSGGFRDLAFAWQTTTNVSPETIHHIVTVIAAPWKSWAVNAVPSLANVAGSRVILKEGVASLNDVDLKSWWSFICYAMLFYAVIPRGLLLLGCWITEKVALAGIDFNDTESMALFRRMTLPVIDEADEFVPAPPLHIENAERNKSQLKGQYYENAIFTVLLPDDIDYLPEEKIKEMVASNLHGQCDVILSVQLDAEDDIDIWKKISANQSILLIMEGWQPCTMEYLEYIKALRENVGKLQLLVVGLTGYYKGDDKKDIPDSSFTDWNYQLSTLRDPMLEVDVLG